MLGYSAMPNRPAASSPTKLSWNRPPSGRLRECTGGHRESSAWRMVAFSQTVRSTARVSTSQTAASNTSVLLSSTAHGRAGWTAHISGNPTAQGPRTINICGSSQAAEADSSCSHDKRCRFGLALLGVLRQRSACG